MSPQDFKAHCVKVKKIKTLAERGSTEGERAAAEAALDRIEPSWRLSDEQLLAELGA